MKVLGNIRVCTENFKNFEIMRFSSGPNFGGEVPPKSPIIFRNRLCIPININNKHVWYHDSIS